MRKLYLAITAFAALLISQIGHAIPTIPGATDIATTDGETFYALTERDGGWHIDGYDSDGNLTGFTTQLANATGSSYLSTDKQKYVGLAFDGNTFYGLRDDLAGAKNTDTYSAIGFGMDGLWDGSRTVLNDGVSVVPTKQVLVGYSYNDLSEQFIALRDDSISKRDTDTWSQIGFALEGDFNGYSVQLEIAPSDLLFTQQVSWNPDIATDGKGAMYTQNGAYSVPEPGTGILFGSLAALGLLGRRKIRGA